VKIALKSLLVWLLLLAVPFQGFASATMLLCAPMTSVSQSASTMAMPAGHDHQAMLAAQALADPVADPVSTDKAASHHASGKCHSCASCCLGAAIAPTEHLRITVATQQVASLPFHLPIVATVDLALPERPPQASAA
jgi:hypothetical protein